MTFFYSDKFMKIRKLGKNSIESIIDYDMSVINYSQATKEILSIFES